MILLNRRKTVKVQYRSQLNLNIIIHDYTIDKLPEQQKQFIRYLSKFKIFEDDHILEMNDFSSIEEYKLNMRILLYWNEVFKTLPIVKLDGRIQLGEYKLPVFKTIENEFNTDNLFLLVRSSKRYTDQLIEIIYK